MAESDLLQFGLVSVGLFMFAVFMFMLHSNG